MSTPVTVVTCMHAGSRKEQQDDIRVSSGELAQDRGLLCILSDGMGGMSYGSMFSRIVCDTMVSEFEHMTGCGNMDMCDILQQCYEITQDTAIKAQSEEEYDQGGATLTAVLVRAGRCAFLSVGDSRIALLRNGGLIHLSRDQNFGVRLDERAAFGFISEEQARNNTQRDALTACLGKQTSTLPDICSRPFELMEGDRIIQMSDGVYRTLHDHELEKLLSSEAEDPAESVIQAVLEKQAANQDNCSIAVITYGSPLSHERRDSCG